ncbi:hypothetical protein WICMUC_004146 [Wickerhamomyces mucosus]|uniref:Glycosyltransferase family 8 protein n=1 Tax=Wickerhamomyces mucosus TaxID=1378264 RepID=A0A9P8TBT4_9ASCO|nr:hypothetical protein WICMUC_004146 [Wickerhamomyces mucosus]
MNFNVFIQNLGRYHPILRKKVSFFALLVIAFFLVLISFHHLLRTIASVGPRYQDPIGDSLVPNVNSKVDFDRQKIRYIYPEVINYLYQHINKDIVDWKKNAYVLYATSETFVCNAMMMLALLRQYGSRAQMVLLLEKDLLNPGLEEFAEIHDVNLKFINRTVVNKGSYWQSSLTKLLVFNQTEYERIIYLDSDSTLPKDHLDELFFIPDVQLATVPAYWLIRENFFPRGKPKYNLSKLLNAGNHNFHNNIPLTSDERTRKIHDLIDSIIKPFENKYDQKLPLGRNANNFNNILYDSLPNYDFLEEYFFSSMLMVIKPSEKLFNKIERALRENRKDNEFDMDVLNRHVFHAPSIPFNQFEEIPELLILPHQIYGCLSAELNINRDHVPFLADIQDLPFIQEDFGKIPYYNIRKPIFDDPDYSESEQFFPHVKFAHFSDSPIPKPWIAKKKEGWYMKHRTRCLKNSFIDDFEVAPEYTTNDCKAGEFWENLHEDFATQRKNVCGLKLLNIIGDAYDGDIN